MKKMKAADHATLSPTLAFLNNVSGFDCWIVMGQLGVQYEGMQSNFSMSIAFGMARCVGHNLHGLKGILLDNIGLHSTLNNKRLALQR